MKSLIFFCLVFCTLSCNLTDGKKVKIPFENEGATYWSIQNSDDKLIMLIDSKYIVNLYKTKVYKDSYESGNYEIHYVIDNFMQMKDSSTFITDTDSEIQIKIERIDSLRIDLGYSINNEEDILKLSTLKLDSNQITYISENWQRHFKSFENDTMIQFSGNEHLLKFDFIHQGKIKYSSVASIVDTSESIINTEMGNNLIVRDLKTNELYTIPNFFNNQNHFYPIEYKYSNIKRNELRIQKTFEYLKRYPEVKAGDTIPSSVIDEYSY